MIKLSRLKITLLLLFIAIAGIALFNYLPNKSVADCKNPTKLEDYTDRKERLVICKDTIRYGNQIVTTRKDAPDLFGYRFNDKETWDVTQEVVAYKLDNKEFIAIFSVENPQTWYLRSGYIFQKDGNDFKLIFNKSFKDLNGRWAGVRFDENGSVFDSNAIAVNQDFGYMGPLGQRIYWRDYYIWDSAKNTYILANDKMSFRLDEIRKTYDELDQEACGNESPSMKGRRISALYESRKNHEHFCDDSSPVPFISNNQAEMFLKAKKALDEIGQGKNYSFNEIKNIDLE
jgi:hypothetical protein